MEQPVILGADGRPYVPEYVNTTLTNPAEWFEMALSGGFGSESSSGQHVNEASGLRVVAVLACVRIYADDVAKLPLRLYQKLGDRSRRQADDHPTSRVISIEPNPEMSAFTFWQTIVKDWARAGNGYAEIVWRGDTKYGRVVAQLWPLEFETITPKRDRNDTLYYEQSGTDGPRIIPADRMFHIRWMGDGILGWSPIRMARERIGIAMSEDQYAGSSLKNDATPGGVLEMPGILQDDAAKRLRENWKKVHSGPNNRREIAILEQDLKYHPLSPPAEDMQFIERVQYSVEDIARLFRIPPHKIQDLARSTNNNIEHQGIEYVQDTLSTPLVCIEQEIKRKLLPGKQNEPFYAKHNVNALLRGDSAARSAWYREMSNIGVYSPNDILMREDENPIDDGDEHFVNGTMVPLHLAKEGPPAWREQPQQSSADANGNQPPVDATQNAQNRLESVLKAHKPVASAAIRRLLAVAHDKVSRESKRDGGAARLLKFFDDSRNAIVETMQPIAESLLASLQAACPEKTLKVEALRPCEGALVVFADEMTKKSVRDLKSRENLEHWTNGRADEDAARLVENIAKLIA